jgi:hypothetical protein
MLIEATEADERRQRTEDRRKPFGTAQGLTASRLLTSAINGFYDLNDFNGWNGF